MKKLKNVNFTSMQFQNIRNQLSISWVEFKINLNIMRKINSQILRK